MAEHGLTLVLVSAILLPCLFNGTLWWLDRRLAAQLCVEATGIKHQAAPLGNSGISFLIPAWNESRTIRRCLQALLTLPYPDLEIIVCAGGEDDTYALARGFGDPRLILLEQKQGEGKQRSLQRCLEVSHGPLIYLLDGDCVLEPGTFFRCIQPILAGEEEVVTCGGYTPLPEQLQLPFVRLQISTQISAVARQPRYSAGLLGGSCAITREALHQAGEFKNEVRTGTDYDLAVRLRQKNKRILMPRLNLVQAEFPTTMMAYIRQQKRWLKNVLIHARHNKDRHLFVSSMLTSLVGIFMLVTPWICLLLLLLPDPISFLGWVGLCAWLALFIFTLLARVRYLGFSNLVTGMPVGPRLLACLPSYPWLDFFAWSAALFEYTFAPRRYPW